MEIDGLLLHLLLLLKSLVVCLRGIEAGSPQQVGTLPEQRCHLHPIASIWLAYQSSPYQRRTPAEYLYSLSIPACSGRASAATDYSHCYQCPAGYLAKTAGTRCSNPINSSSNNPAPLCSTTQNNKSNKQTWQFIYNRPGCLPGYTSIESPFSSARTNFSQTITTSTRVN